MAIRPNGGAKIAIDPNNAEGLGCCFRANCHSPQRGAKIAIDPNNAEGLGFVLGRIAIRPYGTRKDCQ